MANKCEIQNYLLCGEGSYFSQKNRNGQILMLSGVWGIGKTHFWKNDIEENLIKKLKEDDKSYVYISLYGKDSIEELQNEIYQLSYSFSIEDDNKIISAAYSVFTKVTSFIPKISIFGIEVELDKTTEKVQVENMKEKIKKGIHNLMNGGVICFDDFERKSSKIDLNDLFGFITNLTEVFKTKTIIITNQEYFKDNDSKVFNRIKEKSVNKFLLLNPTVDELFETVYKDKYEDLNEYKTTILEAIKVTEEKNARIFIQVLDNCLEYRERIKGERDMYLLVLITVLFVKYNIIIRMEKVTDSRAIPIYRPRVLTEMPNIVQIKIDQVSGKGKEEYIRSLKRIIALEITNKEELDISTSFIDNNDDLLYQISKHFFVNELFNPFIDDENLIATLNDFVETGILKDEN